MFIWPLQVGALSLPDHAWIVPLLSLAGGALGGVFGSYFAKRGEIAAIHSQLDKVVTQNNRITEEAEEIKRQVSGRQRIWELKQEAAYDALKLIVTINHTFTDILTLEIQDPRRMQAIDRLGTAMLTTWHLQAVFSFLFAETISVLIDDIFSVGLKITTDAINGTLTDEARKSQVNKFQELRQKLIVALRDELKKTT